MAIRLKQLVVIGLLVVGTGAVMTSPGRAAEQDSARKITKKVAAVYPLIARKMQLTGTVRLAAVVAPAGHVKSTEPLGGHPVLVVAATDAAIQWKFQAADRESRETLVFTFTPQ